MAHNLPSYSSVSITGRKVLHNRIGVEQGPTAVLENTCADSGSTPTTRMRPGNVIVKRASSGEYVEANDSNGDRCTPAAVTALETADDDWESGVIRITGHWGTIDVTLAGTDDTDAEVVAAINTALAAVDPEQGPCKASVSGSRVVITNRDKGAGTYLEVYHTTVSTAFGAAGASTTMDVGEDADYLVIDEGEYPDMVDEQGTARSAPVRTLQRGNFVTANLINLTSEARAVLSRRGSRFS